jgi:hypothetical protein
MASIKEAYTNPDVAQGDFYSAQQIRYREVEPNRFLPDAIKGNLGTGIVNSALSQFNKYDPYTESVSNKFTAAGLNEILKGQGTTTDEETYCRGFVNAASIPKLLADQEAQGNLPVRCGWRYKKSPGGGAPLVSQGALGTINGPLNAQADPLGNGVEWIWDLKKAMDRHLRDYARPLPLSATGLQAVQAAFPNTAYCSQTNSYIMLDANGNPAQGYRCAQNSIVRNPSNFPQVPQTSATSMASANTNSLASCMRPGNNKSLTRDCLLQAVRTNGCSSEGTLYQAIESAKPTASTYSQFLQTQPSFLTYQSKQGSNKITDDLFNKERGSWDMATREIQKLQRYTQTAQDPLVKVAAEDLCLNAGKFDQYDFCSDLTESTNIASVDLKCLQNYWQEQNGKPAGILYPSSRSLKPQLGRVTTWGEYRKAVDTLKSKVNSTNPIEQRTAINNFLGVTVSTDPFTPLNIDGLSQGLSLGGQPLVFWVDAKDGGSLTIDENNRVRSWSDKSGRKNDVIQTNIASRPVYKREAFPGLEFDGNGKFMPIPNAYNLVRANFTIFVVDRRKSDKNENYFLGGTQLHQRNGNLVLGYANSNRGLLAYWANDLSAPIPPYQMSSEPMRIWSFMKTGSGRSIYINGKLSGSDNNMEQLLGWNDAAIGRYYDRFYQGTVYEILIFNTDLTMDRRQKIEGYLANKWGLSTSLEDSHPYKVSAP